MASARAALRRRSWVGPALGVALTALALTVVLRLGVRAFDWALPFWPTLAGASLVVLAHEWGIALARASRLRGVCALFEALVEGLGESGQPRVWWAHGLPRLSGRVGEVDVAVHLETVGFRALRLGLTVALPTAAPVWIASRLPQDFPVRLVARMRGRGGYAALALPEEPEGPELLALTREPERAAAMLATPALLEAMRPCLVENAPCAATLEFAADGVRWDTLLTPQVRAEGLLALARAIVEWPGVQPPAELSVEDEAEVEDEVAIVEGDEACAPSRGA